MTARAWTLVRRDQMNLTDQITQPPRRRTSCLSQVSFRFRFGYRLLEPERPLLHSRKEKYTCLQGTASDTNETWRACVCVCVCGVWNYVDRLMYFRGWTMMDAQLHYCITLSIHLISQTYMQGNKWQPWREYTFSANLLNSLYSFWARELCSNVT